MVPNMFNPQIWGFKEGIGASLALFRISLLLPKRHDRNEALFPPSLYFLEEHKLFKLKDD